MALRKNFPGPTLAWPPSPALMSARLGGGGFIPRSGGWRIWCCRRSHGGGLGGRNGRFLWLSRSAGVGRGLGTYLRRRRLCAGRISPPKRGRRVRHRRRRPRRLLGARRRRVLPAARLRRLRPRLPALARLPRLCTRRVFIRLFRLGRSRCALAAGASVSWWAGGGPSVPLAVRLASRSAALVSAVAASGAGRGFVGFVSSPCPAGLVPSPSPSACFSGFGSGSWASLALASGLGLARRRLPRRSYLPPQAIPAPPARSPPRGARGCRWRRPGRAPPGRAVSASRPPLRCSSAARRGAGFSENSAYVWEKRLAKPPGCGIIGVRGHNRETYRWAGGVGTTPAPDHRR